jgi:ubiquinone/menaquinone biosynthesis C-methylase UbiE
MGCIVSWDVQREPALSPPIHGLAQFMASSRGLLYPHQENTKAILDFGAGTGLLTLGLLPYVAHVTAVDASDEMLQVLADKLKAMGIKNVNTRHCDIGKEPLPDADYFLVASSIAPVMPTDADKCRQHLDTRLF